MLSQTIRNWIVLLTIGSLSLLVGQNTGTLSGTVKNTVGAPIPNATVTVTNTATNATQSTLTGPGGTFTINNLPAGTYHLTVEITGFKRLSQQDIVLTTGAAVPLNLTLEAGNVQETVEIKGESPAVQDSNGEVARSYNTRTLQQLPVLDRNTQQLVELMPGITPPAPLLSPLTDPQANRIWETNGIAYSANHHTLDGVENDEPFMGLAVHVPTLESVQEMGLVTANYDASVGRVGGTALNLATRPGTNGLHGSLFEFNANAWFRARNFFDPKPNPMPKYNFNEFGGSAGGPIVKDKTFFFGSYEGDFLRQGIPTYTTVPTAAFRAGDFSAVPGLMLFNPATGFASGTGRTPFTNNMIPASSINPVALSILQHIPLPNRPGFENNFFANVPFTSQDERFDARLDQHFSERTGAFLRYGYTNDLIGEPSILGTIGEGANGHLRSDNAQIDVTHGFSPSLLTDLRLNYDLYRNRINPIAGGPLASDVGFTNAGFQPVNGGLPSIQIAGMQGLGTPPNWPEYNVDSDFNLVNSWTKTAGRHQFRAGADVWWIRMDGWLNPPYSTLGSFQFEPGGTALPGAQIGQFGNFANSFASFLLGAPTEAGIGAQTVRPSLLTTAASGWIADNVKVSSMLTLDLGLRYEFFRPLQPRRNSGVTIYNPVTGTLNPVGTNGVDSFGNVQYDTDNFAPRFGFAFHPMSRTVIRGGYGISYWPGTLDFSAATFNYSNIGVAQGVAGGFGTTGFVVPTLPAATAGRLAPNATLAYSPSRLQTPYVQTFDFMIQQDLGQSTTIDIGYVGDLGRELPYTRNVNAALPGTGVAGLPFFTTFGQTAPVLQRATGLTSNYNALQVNATRRFVHGLAFTAAYTYSKALDYGGGLLPLLDNNNIRNNYGPADFDRTHMFTFSHVWELPFGAGTEHLNQGVIGHILGPWQVDGIFRYATGTPWTPTASAALCACPGNTPRADLVPAGTSTAITLEPTFFGFFPIAFPVQNYAFAQPAAGTLGNVGRNFLRTGSFTNYDLSLFRSFVIVEQARLELRATAYNIANSANFGPPITNVNSPNFGEATSTAPGLGERTLQFALRLVF